jgi:hypothetical protein
MSIVPQHMMDTVMSGLNSDDRWLGSANARIKPLPSTTKGKVGEDIAKRRLGDFIEADLIGPGTADCDALVDGLKVEIKMSTLWAPTRKGSEGIFKFQQLRVFNDFDRCIFVAVHPNETRIWWATRADLDEHVFSNDKLKQHGGKKESSGLYWFEIDGGPKEWFRDMEEWVTYAPPVDLLDTHLESFLFG